ncbi:MAG: hypothetical protein IJ781_10285 [Atopobiaceae bacterium]|nr:hypothetical protein [Atopobiaceae bacterium]
MPEHGEMEAMLDANGERSLAEFPDDAAWAELKAEVMGAYAPDPDEGGSDGDR